MYGASDVVPVLARVTSERCFISAPVSGCEPSVRRFLVAPKSFAVRYCSFSRWATGTLRAV